jgi:hypothetical protein
MRTSRNICVVEHVCLDGRVTALPSEAWTGPPIECNDGVDNDGDGRTDFGDDPGCNSPEDDDETDSCDINGTSEADVLVGTSASEIICGWGGADTITGNRGNDNIGGGGGSDNIGGGSGSDTIDGDTSRFGSPTGWTGPGSMFAATTSRKRSHGSGLPGRPYRTSEGRMIRPHQGS